MSEKTKGDTSTPPPASAVPLRVVKNPLLSASVTGLTFDDFPNKPLLLPAAPPIVPPAATAAIVPPVSTTLAPGAIGRGETKSLVTVGSSVSDLDSEILDEINLNAASEDTQPAIIDTNANPLLDPQELGTESILSQAASSFSALPSVASSVFSSFSKRIYSGSSSRERTPTADNFGFGVDAANGNSFAPQQDIPRPYLPQADAQPQLPTAPVAISTPLIGQLDSSLLPPVSALNNVPSLAEPPKFYTPAELSTLPATATTAPPPVAANQNSYRLSAKKKLYAPIPGLTNQPHFAPAAVNTAAANVPLAFDAVQPLSQAPPQFDAYSAPQPYQLPTEESKVNPEERKGGLFSLSNLVPSGVLQNISGLVQSATGTKVEPSPADTYQQQAPTDISFGTNYFAGAPINTSQAVAPVPPAVFYTPQNIDVSTQFLPHPTFYTLGEVSTLPPPPPVSLQSVPEVQNTASENSGLVAVQPPPQFGFVTPPPKSKAAEIVGLSPHTENLVAPNQQPVTIFDPTILQTAPTALAEQSTASVASFFQPEQLATSSAEVRAQTAAFPAAPIAPVAKTSQLTESNLFKPIEVPTVAGSAIAPPVTGKTTATLFEPLPVAASIPVAAPFAAVALVPAEGPTLLRGPPLSVTSLAQSSLPTVATPPPAAAHLPPAAAYLPPAAAYLPPAAAYLPPAAAHLPPAATYLPPAVVNLPPAAASAPTSFRLQKGTRHYKNPLTVAETVTSFAAQPSHAAPQTIVQPAAAPEFFNPFAPPTTVSKPEGNIATAAPTSNYFVPHVGPSTPSETPSVPLFEPIPIANLAEKAAPVETPTLFEADFQPESTAKPFIDVFQQNIPVELVQPSQVPEADASLFSHADAESCLIQQTIEPVIPAPTEEELTESRGTPIIAKEQLETVAQAVQDLSLKTEALVAATEDPKSSVLPPPPDFPANPLPAANSNPFRKGNVTLTKPVNPPILANFFTPASAAVNSNNDFNLFAECPPTAPPLETSAAIVGNTNSAADGGLTNFFVNSASSALREESQSIPEGLFPPLPTPPVVATVASERKAATNAESQVPLYTAPPPIGFDNLVAATATATNLPIPTTGSPCELDIPTAQAPTTAAVVVAKAVNHDNNSTLNSFSNYFEQTSNLPVVAVEQKPANENESQQSLSANSSCFFDSFVTQSPNSTKGTSILTTVPSNEEQRIQNFFNNPPPKDASGVGDLNYDLVHSGVAVKQLLNTRSSPVSNIVEPPSSSCSEWSELNTSGAAAASAQKFLRTSPEKLRSVEAATATLQRDPIEAQTNACEPLKHYEDLPEDILLELRMSNSQITEGGGASYKPAIKHWFYKRQVGEGTKPVWTPFSHYDSALLETTLEMGDEAPDLVAVEGGRYDLNIRERTKSPVYWEGPSIEVRRCSWFYKAVDNKYVPYEEQTAELLEAEYKQAFEKNVWHNKIVLSMGEQVEFHGPTVIVHFQQQQNIDAWGGTSQTTSRPRVVKRDLNAFSIEQGEAQRVDHLLFMVHGIGAACDLKMRSVEEVVDEFRGIAQQLVQSHYKNSTDKGVVGRVEVLPISWHSHLHSEEMGIDEKLKSITLESIPRLRNFTNDTLLDVLFYTSPTYCQRIMNRVAASMNAVYVKYRKRHPEFNGGVSLAGHSLGSLILFDLLCHQQPVKESEEQNLENPDQVFSQNNTDDETKHISYTMGPAGTGQPFINYAQLIFQPKKFFALGSPIGMFVTIRGIDKLGLDFRLPTCPGFYNIFHPFDPVAYRIEALVNPDMSGVRPVLIAHHKGRKRMHLELKETMTRVGADIKQRFFDTFKTTLETVNFLGSSRNTKKQAEEIMEKEVDRVIEMQIQLEQEESVSQATLSPPRSRTRADSAASNLSDMDMVEVDFPMGKLNDSKRIDYVLQEAPLEFINEYLFALTSHVCYWESEDTILFVMKEIYSGLGISTDSQVPQQTMTIERPSSDFSLPSAT